MWRMELPTKTTIAETITGIHRLPNGIAAPPRRIAARASGRMAGMVSQDDMDVLELPTVGSNTSSDEGMTTEPKAHQGALSNTTLPSLIYSILRRGETGVLTLKDHGIEKSLYI